MIVGCHYHLEHRLLAENELLKKMDECAVDKVALMAVLNEPIPAPPEFLLNIFPFCIVAHFISLYRKTPF